MKMNHTIALKRTRIIATLGPSSSTPEMVKKLVQQGVNLFRLNFSHGDHETHLKAIQLIRQVEKQLNCFIGIIGDLSGPKIRIGKFANNQILLKQGALFEITIDKKVIGNEKIVSTSYPYLVKDVRLKDKVLLDDGNITLVALSKTKHSVRFKVVEGGILKNNKGINLPGIPLSVSSITQKDKIDFKFMLEHGVDYVALSFVRDDQDILTLKKMAKGRDIPVIAKIEKPEAVDNIDKILKVTDVVMVARGDLGVEIPIEMVPGVQKKVISACKHRGIPVITATQMLESMIQNTRPTRAETTDVFNAIIDGSDAVMLSGETASGQYPVEAVKVMSAIALEAEEVLRKNYVSVHPAEGQEKSVSLTCAFTACQAALDLHAKAILAFTKNGNTVRRISKFHPPFPVIALARSATMCRFVGMFYGVIPILVEDIKNTDEILKSCEKVMQSLKLAIKNEIVVIVAGIPMGEKGNTNFVKFHRIQ